MPFGAPGAEALADCESRGQVLERNAELAAEAEKEYAIEEGVRSDAGFGVSFPCESDSVTACWC